MQELDFTIKTKEDLIAAVERLGFLPFFANSIKGFSVEEHVARDIWFTDVEGPWEWKGPVIRKTGCAYGKFFENKAAYISPEWFADFANYRRDGYDFDARFDDGLVSFRDKELFDLIDANAPILSKDLKEIGNYGKNGKKGFETLITRLQAQCYVVINDFVYLTDKHGKSYGWGVSVYSTPEHLMKEHFTDRVYRDEPRDSYEKILDHLHRILPDASEKALKAFLK